MAFGKKGKKEPKIEKVFDNSSDAKGQENAELVNGENTQNMSDEDKLILGVDKEEKSELTEAQKEKLEELGSVKDKLARLLKSSNIEIIDENFGDEYETGSSSSSGGGQQDYDALKDLMGPSAEKKKELTLTIDDYDYTYTGQYLDEFDVSHLKIKRIRLQNKYAKKIKKIALIASLVMVVVGGAVGAYFLMRETPVYLKSISLNKLEDTYFVNQEFDYSGLYILAEYSNGKVERIKLKPSHLQDKVGNIVQEGDVLQFTGTQPASLTFAYGGKTVDLSVTIATKQTSGLKAHIADGLFNLDAGDKISQKNLRLILKYSNFDATYLDYSGENTQIYINNALCNYDSASGSFIASASTKPTAIGERSSAVIKVVYGGYEVEIKDISGTDVFETA